MESSNEIDVESNELDNIEDPIELAEYLWEDYGVFNSKQERVIEMGQ